MTGKKSSFFIFATFLIGIIYATVSETSQNPQLEKILKLEMESEIPNVINITDAQDFVALVAAIRRERPYDVAIFYNIPHLNREEKCKSELCDKAEEQFIQAAYSYR